MKKVVVLIVLIFTVNVAFVACKSEKKEADKEHVSADGKHHDVYQCPMKCEKEKTYEKEGECPVCKMKLKKKEHEAHNEDKEHEEDHNH